MEWQTNKAPTDRATLTYRGRGANLRPTGLDVPAGSQGSGSRDCDEEKIPFRAPTAALNASWHDSAFSRVNIALSAITLHGQRAVTARAASMSTLRSDRRRRLLRQHCRARSTCSFTHAGGHARSTGRPPGETSLERRRFGRCGISCYCNGSVPTWLRGQRTYMHAVHVSGDASAFRRTDPDPFDYSWPFEDCNVWPTSTSAQQCQLRQNTQHGAQRARRIKFHAIMLAEAEPSRVVIPHTRILWQHLDVRDVSGLKDVTSLSRLFR
eukprot:351893-Chlamydomonas_euryale.AAC.35